MISDLHYASWIFTLRWLIFADSRLTTMTYFDLLATLLSITLPDRHADYY
jgi:hypothetical protein